MNARHLACLAVASLLVGTIAVTPLPSIDRPAETPAEVERARVPAHVLHPDRGPTGADRSDLERQRIRDHLRGAERILRAADVSHLSDAQHERRARVIELLREYRRAGAFPHNHDFPGERMPYFVDRHGTLCAMAYVIAQTGGAELVRRVARTANNARVPELADDPEFAAWLDRHGMTVAEAARVQPMYGCCRIPPASEDPDAGYAMASVGHAALGGAAVALQLTGDGEAETWRTVFGLASGGLGIGLAAAGLRGSTRNHELAALNLGLGAATLGTVAWRLLRGDDAGPATADEESGRELSWSARPAISGETGTGVVVTLSF